MSDDTRDDRDDKDEPKRFDWGLNSETSASEPETSPPAQKPAAPVPDSLAFLLGDRTPPTPPPPAARHEAEAPEPSAEDVPTQAMTAPVRDRYVGPPAEPVPPADALPLPAPWWTPREPDPVPEPAETPATEAFTFDAATRRFIPPSQHPSPDPAETVALVSPVPAGAPAADAAPASPLDSLFGDSQFQDYAERPTPAAFPAEEEYGARAPLSRAQRVLIGVAAGLVALLVLVAAYVGGTHLPGLVPKAAAVASASPKPSVTPTPTKTAVVVGPLAPGTYAWDALLGSECVSPFASAWEQEYTVVPCDGDHAAQLVAHGTFDDATYPGADVLAKRITTLCSKTGVIDYAKAKKYTDLELSVSYPSTTAEWTAGHHAYNCFASRSSDKLLSASIAVKK